MPVEYWRGSNAILRVLGEMVEVVLLYMYDLLAYLLDILHSFRFLLSNLGCWGGAPRLLSGRTRIATRTLDIAPILLLCGHLEIELSDKAALKVLRPSS